MISGITPHTDRWLELRRRADLFAMARHEAFGIVYEEAGASGIPAIGGNINAVLKSSGTAAPVFSCPGDREGPRPVPCVPLVDSSVLQWERMWVAPPGTIEQRAVCRRFTPHG